MCCVLVCVREYVSIPVRACVALQKKTEQVERVIAYLNSNLHGVMQIDSN